MMKMIPKTYNYSPTQTRIFDYYSTLGYHYSTLGYHFKNRSFHSSSAVKSSFHSSSAVKSLFHSSSAVKSNDAPRKNPVGIQMISSTIYNQLFLDQQQQQAASSELISLSKKHLEHHELLGKNSKDLPEISDFALPKLTASSIAQHFEILGLEQASTFMPMADTLTNATVPKMPPEWQRLTGWVRYDESGFQQVECPTPGEPLVFDVEVLYKISPYPVIATACSPTAWYSWVMPGFFDPSPALPNHLIPLGDHDQARLVVGHFVAYDRARIKEEYKLESSKIGFIDTLSLHSAVGGLSTQQRIKWLNYKNEKSKLKNDLVEISQSKTLTETQKDALSFFMEEKKEAAAASGDYKRWEDMGSTNSLDNVTELHLGIKMDKTARKEFDATDISPLSSPALFQEIMNYCAKDVQVTFNLFQSVYPKFIKKCPHPVSFAGMMHMGKAYLTTGDNWNQYIKKSEEKCQEYRDEIESKLNGLANEALALLDSEKYKDDPWLRYLDWTVKPVRMTKEKVSAKGVVTPSRPFASSNQNLAGKPQWYRDLWDSKTKKFRLSTSKKSVPYLLRLEWKGHPVVYEAKFGWMFHGLPDDLGQIKDEQPVEQGQDFMIDGHVYYRIPHPSGEGKNVGNPLSKAFIKAFETDTLTSSFPEAKRLLSLNSLCIYWISARARIKSQFVMWDEKGQITGYKEGKLGVIIPQTASMGTVTRRATDATWMTASNAKSSRVGSELKAQIVAPKGYKFVGADVDSEELWIASLLGDSQFGIHGATAIGFMTLQGTKSLGTDLHSTSGRIVGISRNVAKIFNYSRIYGAGQNYAAQLLVLHNPGLSKTEAQGKAAALYRKTKGTRFRDDKRLFGGETFWFGGSETFMFNKLEQIANSIDTRTPILGCQIPDTLSTEYVNDMFKTSRINWVVQSSGVDYLHLLLVSMDYLMRRMKIRGRFLLSIHDEVRFLIHDDDVAKAALALQISNLWTRCLFASRVGMNDLPMNAAFFSAIDIDHVMRKEVDMDCVTPSNSIPISPGVSQDIYNVLDSVKLKDGSFPLDIYGEELSSILDTISKIPPSPPPKESKASENLLFIKAQMCDTSSNLKKLLSLKSSSTPSRRTRNVGIIKKIK